MPPAASRGQDKGLQEKDIHMDGGGKNGSHTDSDDNGSDPLLEDGVEYPTQEDIAVLRHVPYGMPPPLCSAPTILCLIMRSLHTLSLHLYVA